MRRIFRYIPLFFLIAACDSPNAPDCLKTAGSLIQESFEVQPFTQIVIEDDVALEIKQGSTQEVIIETGENLLDAISVSVNDGILRIQNDSSCELLRDYGLTTAMITAPNITNIRNSSAFDVTSKGVLRYPRLTLTSNTTAGVENPRKSGDFTLDVECESFFVEANGQSGFYITGFTEKATLAFEDEAPRFEGENFIINELIVFQRSANKMIVNPRASITGNIFGTGDVIAIHRPPIVDVEEFFTGRLIFQD